jgi:hypothetical protein
LIVLDAHGLADFLLVEFELMRLLLALFLYLHSAHQHLVLILLLVLFLLLFLLRCGTDYAGLPGLLGRPRGAVH